jgi:outer membrane protein assembly factor BamE
MQIRTLFISIALLLSLTHCASYDFSRRVAKQGNLLPTASIEQLKVGMNKDTVATLMGTSLIHPIFNDDRWDYAYTIRRGSHPLEIHNLRLYFNHGVLSRIEHQP